MAALHGIFDTHAHYTDLKFADEAACPGGAEGLLRGLFTDGGVERILNVSVSVTNSREVVAQAARFPGMYAAVGIHPTELSTDGLSADDALAALDGMLREREQNKIVAVGEIGLDYYWEPYDKKAQAEMFDAQLSLAERYDLPVSIHDRDAHGDTFETLLAHPHARGVLHAYSGSAELARELLRRGWYIAFGGVLTFKNAARVRAAAETIPADRLLLETDCPYLSPEPFRGKLNHSGRIAQTAAVLGALHGMSGEEMTDRCFRNACALFGMNCEN